MPTRKPSSLSIFGFMLSAMIMFDFECLSKGFESTSRRVACVNQQAMRSDKTLLTIAPCRFTYPRVEKNMTKEWSFLFRSDRGMEMIMNGSHYQGRYQVTQEIGQTVYIRAELRPLAANALDELLQVSQDVSKVEVKHFSFYVLGDTGTLKLDDFLRPYN